MIQQSISFYGTTIGKKAVMAFTGAMMVGFVLIHLLGNLQVFAGAERVNHYSALLHAAPTLLWSARAVLGLALLTHILTGALLILAGLRGRSQGYALRRFQTATYASRTMRWTGPLMAVFISYHLLHNTIGVIHPAFAPGDIYQNVVLGLTSVPDAAAYVLAMLLLGLHLKHGLWSLMQTLGLNSARSDRLLRGISAIVALLVIAGFITIPLAVLAGLLS